MTEFQKEVIAEVPRYGQVHTPNYLKFDFSSNYQLDVNSNVYIPTNVSQTMPQQTVTDGTIPTSIPYINTVVGDKLNNPSSIGLITVHNMVTRCPHIALPINFLTILVLNTIGEYVHQNKEIQVYVRHLLNNCYQQNNYSKRIFREKLSALKYGFATHYKKIGITKIGHDTYNKYELIPLPQPSVDFYADQEGNLKYISQKTINAMANISMGYGYADNASSFGGTQIPTRMPLQNIYKMIFIDPANVTHFSFNLNEAINQPFGTFLVEQVYDLYLQWVQQSAKLQDLVNKKVTPAYGVYCSPTVNLQYKDPITGQTVTEKLVQSVSRKIQAGGGINAGNIYLFDAIQGEGGLTIDTIDVAGDLAPLSDNIDRLSSTIRNNLFMFGALGGSGSSEGSYALGSIQMTATTKTCDLIADMLCENVINDYIKDNIELNFGKQLDYGRFTRRVLGIDEKLKYAKLYETMNNTGLSSMDSIDDKNLMRETLGLDAEDELEFEANKLLRQQQEREEMEARISNVNTNQFETKAITNEPYANNSDTRDDLTNSSSEVSA